MNDDEFGDAPTVAIEPRRQTMAAWAKEKGHVHIRKAMSLAPANIGGRRAMVQVPASEKPKEHVFGAASLVMSARGIRQAGFASKDEYHAALLGTVVTEAEYDEHTAAFHSIVIR